MPNARFEALLLSGDLFRSPKSAEYFEAVYKQARAHCLRNNKLEFAEVIDQLRPNEMPDTKKFRLKNTKQITRAGAEMFLSKSSRIISQSVQSDEQISKTLKAWLSDKRFLYGAESYTHSQYLQQVLYKRASISPNDIIVAFPYNPNNELTPPIWSEDKGGVPKNEHVPIQIKIISYEDRLTDEFVCFQGGEIALSNNKRERLHPYYFIADEVNWYLMLPQYVKGENNRLIVKYIPVLWYEHNSGENLLNTLPGTHSHSWDKQHHFKESHLHIYYEYADLALAAHSDDVIVRKRFSYPIVAMKRQKCQTKGCENGYIDRDREKPCQNCHQGWQYMPGPNGILIKEDNPNPIKGSNSTDKIFEFINPDIRYAEQSMKVPDFFLQKGKRALGLDLMEGSGANASGDALRERKEDFQDIMNRIAQSLFECWDRLMWHIECLLVEDEAERVRPKTIIPQTIRIKSEHELREDAEQALQEDKFHARLEYYRRKYQDHPSMIRFYEILLCYTPYLYINIEELQILIAKGICESNDLIRKQFGAIALKSILKDIDLGKITNEQVHEKMDDYLKGRGLIKEEVKVELFGGAVQEENTIEKI